MTVSKERTLLASFCVLIIMLIQLKMILSVPEKVNIIYGQEKKQIFGKDSLIKPETRADAVLDRDINTSWKINFTKPSNYSEKSYVPDENTNFIQMELSLTHFPGKHPEKNPLQYILLWPGTYESGIFSKKYARPSLIRLVFFDQELVDVDREFRLPEPPFYVAEKTVRIPDGEGPVKLPADFLREPKDSENFPANIYQRWLRIEVLDIYPGTIYKQELAVAEIDYLNAISDHEPFIYDKRR